MSVDLDVYYSRIDDLRHLKQRRTTRRRAITILEQYVQSASKTPRSELNPDELSGKFDKLNDLVKDHAALQSRIE